MSELIVRPGDVLIISMEKSITTDVAKRIKDKIRTVAPDLKDVLIISGGSALGVYREVDRGE